MRFRTALFVGFVAAVAVASVGTVASGAATVDAPSDQTSEPVADEHLPDPETDRLGWENGVWYNESIDVTPEDGLNETELDAVVARGMARVEYVRGLEFEETPPVAVISRDEFREEAGSLYGNVTASQRIAENVYYEALLMVDESTDAVGVQESNTAGGVGGYYDPANGEIKIVSENTTTPQMDEITLSQELFHALQDQKFNISSYPSETTENVNARNGIIEGDGNYVDYLYQQSCENEWEGECIMPEESSVPSDFDPHLGLYQIQLQPYSDGPAFVSDLHEQEGWEAVNEVYENPPASTEQMIHPDKYGEDTPTTVTVEDTSGEDWRPLDVENGTDYESFGEAGLYVTLWYPGYEILSEGGDEDDIIIPYRNHLNPAAGGLDEQDPYNYDYRYTAGWDGDRLVPYVTDESFETNETGYVYELVWDSENDAAEFLEGYQQLLDYRGAQPVPDNESTYRIPDDARFGDAFYVQQDGTTVTIVNAPTVEDLSAIRAGAAPPNETTPGETTTEGTTPGETMTEKTTEETMTDEATGATTTDEMTDGETTGASGTTETTTETSDGFGPGFGVLAAVFAAVSTALVASRRL
ncbi:Hvo_1808 family surface protein [Halapricum hydrolyticum]|uniref:Hvo_1808 family surface protein n=1 Tax=Halapricum hydrolyticum TaxID=2979991 RepID=A0AAE3IB06_9EURY|nr:Hvo_1808 family surface protein [Halapricum hydrolyticum]MCU4717669.1 Hvo_1808 family surface protein [Halapricum hydrolyticum]MCU4726802.1 Hvo_1808 family surface protein [Halapricum hydrolyticum]